MKRLQFLLIALTVMCFGFSVKSQTTSDTSNCSLLMQVRTVGEFQISLYYPNDSLQQILIKVPEITKKNGITYEMQLDVLNQEINQVINGLRKSGWRLVTVIHEEFRVRFRYYYFEHIDCG